MSAQPKVSIVIPFYNCEYIDQAIASALAQTYKNIEVIVVDDGSTQYRHLLEPYKDKIRYFYKPNGGTASALNYGITKSTGEYFAWLSADDRYVPEKVERQLAFMDRVGSIASHTAYYYIDASGSRTGEIHANFTTKKEFYETLLSGCPINGCSVMLHMYIFERIGMFDEQRRYTHDYDLWLRLLQHFDFHYLDESLLEYRVHGTMGTLNHWDEIQQDMLVIQSKYGSTLRTLIEKERGRG
ncbi:glycosyltransferase [Paenibacillus zeisoli]|uniref:Glycosyltransferase n=1 Tax=Paenibacillus zeisoli TaxID=2496267 RepID=A0A433X530_9BACL|nr:glycosyltransferase [Paenibacillus zeisoli]RUT29162.1 glycosyltransferase [Paenibacillus zeisoli]